MKHETEPAQVGSKATKEPFRQRRNNCLALWCQPPLAPIADKLGRQDQLTDQKGFIALEARSCWRIRKKHLIAGHAIRVALGPSAPRQATRIASIAFRGLLHARRFERWPRRQALQPGDFIAQVLVLNLQSNPCCFGRGQLVSQLSHLLFNRPGLCDRSTTSRRKASVDSVSDPSSESGVMPS